MFITTKMQSYYNIMYQINMYTLNLRSIVYQIYVNFLKIGISEIRIQVCLNFSFIVS